jgi:transcriptional regulator with PAS, ATPase and Fis domain
MREILLVAGTESGARALGRQLSTLFEGRVDITTRWLDDPASGAVDAPLRPRSLDTIILLSSALVRAELESSGWLPSAATIVVARRTVNPDTLDQVVALPPGTKALFVNDRAETARDCVETLLGLGLDGVDWEPWWPGAPAPSPDRKVAVVPGETALVPEGIEEVIDIGVRILDFGTLAELFGLLGLPADEIGTFSRRYLATIVSLASRLARSNEESRRISGHLGSVIDSLRNGILVFDDGGRVSVCNEELRSLLGLRPGQGSGSILAGLVRNRELLEFLECRCGEESALFKLAEGNILVRRFDLGEGGHTVATFRREVDEALESTKLAREYRRRGHVAKWTMDDIVGESETIRRAKRIAARLARTELSILISGESGTGKELFASAIHAASDRSAGPFLAVDLGALSDDLIESELFGYEEGAFTGAKKGGKPGLFEQADGGTLFLDEIGNISPKVQRRLLRVLQEKEIMRVGGSEIRKVDVRVIAASHEDLLERASRGEFREDLYFRLKMGWIKIPPLRERREDIPLLAARFLELEGARGVAVAAEVLAVFASRSWPGNLRELRNAITYMLAVREGEELTVADLPEDGFFAVGSPQPSAPPIGMLPSAPPLNREAGREGLDEIDRIVLLALAELEGRGRHPGREAVAALCESRGYALGPGAIRNRFERLAALGMVTSRRGRAGTRLTEQGRQRSLS